MDIDLNEIKTNEKMPTIPFRVLRNFVKKNSKQPDDWPISLEFLLTLCFPTVFNNIMSFAKDCYMQGYLEGRSENED